MFISQDWKRPKEFKDQYQELSSKHQLLYTYVQEHPGDREKQKELAEVKQQMQNLQAIIG